VTYVVFPEPVGPIRAFTPGSKMPLQIHESAA